jgi:lysozyme
VEFVGNCTSWRDAEEVRAELGVFVARVEAAWRVKPILYTTAAALEQIIGDSLQGHPIWIRSVLSEPPLDAHRGWSIWQFSETARVPGIAGPVGRNALRTGTSLADLRKATTEDRR